MKKALFVLVIWIVVLGVGELSARLWIDRYGNALDTTRRILAIDPEIGWKQRANLATQFVGASLHTDERGWRIMPREETGGKTVLFLGPSSTFGWGVADNESYPAILEQGSYGFRSVNAGQIGYSSAQGVLLALSKKIKDISASFVVVAYGVNDLDRHRFYYESADDDAAEFAKVHSVVAAQVTNVIFSSSLVNVTFKLLAKAIVRPVSFKVDIGVRVSVDDFRNNMTTIVEKMRERDSKVVLVTTAVHFPKTGEERVLRESERVQNGVSEYNEIVREVASSTGSRLLDLDIVFAGQDPNTLFVDPVHFSKTGNEMIARALADILDSYDR